MMMVIVTGLLFGATATAFATPSQIIECPGTNAHVWDRDQCPRIGGIGIGPGGGGSGGGGLLGTIGRVLGGLTGGLL